MKSWDCFDTLIARRYYNPKTIFDTVGKLLGDKNFREKRIAAEKASNKTYSDIYKRLPGIDPNIEFNVELEHNFPIMENMLQVEDGDYIISDMYLEAHHLEKLLRNAGLTKDVNIVVTPHGKKHGTIWAQVPKPSLHTGDNKIGDVDSPRKVGINANLYTNVWFNQLEEEVALTQHELACWMRYIRLMNPYAKEPYHSLWKDQAHNLAVLALFVKELPEDRELTFTYRDCINLHRLYEIMTGKTAYSLHTSRNAYNYGGETFKNYVLENTKGRLIVDLQGSERAPKAFFNNIPYNITYLCGTSPNSIFPPCGNAIERHNAAPYGTLINMSESLLFVRDKLEWESYIPRIQQEAVLVGLNSIKWYEVKKDKKLLHKLLLGLHNNATFNLVSILSKHKVIK